MSSIFLLQTTGFCPLFVFNQGKCKIDYMLEEKSSKKFLIIDGNALVHRAYHALPGLKTKQGKLVQAVYGFWLDNVENLP